MAVIPINMRCSCSGVRW